MKREDVKKVARLHLESLPDDFFPSLGLNFLEKIFYSGSLSSSSGVTFVRIEDNKIVGFLTMSYNNDFFGDILKRKLSQVIVFFFTKLLLDPKLLRKSLSIFIVEMLKKKKKSKPEIVFIVVGKDFRKKGIGRELISCAIQDLKSKKEKELIVKTLSSNLNALRFYKRIGGIIRREVIRAGKKYKVIFFKI